MTTVAAPALLRTTSMSAAPLMAAVFCGALVITLGLRLPGFIHHDTTEVVMWGNSGWSAGFWKHPPFLPWVSRLWFEVVPMSAAGLSILTALNMTACAWAVWRIASMAGTGDDRTSGVVAVLLLAAVPYATGMAVKLNHNSALISLWPLTTLAFLRAIDRPTAIRGALFGLAAAAAMLTKYYTGLLLVACLIASFARLPRAQTFYRGPAPYVAVGVFGLAMLPHALWMLDHRASSLAYAFGTASTGIVDTKRGPLMALSFAIQTPLILAPMALAAWLFHRFGRIMPASGRPHRFEREILILAILPYILTVVLTTFFNLRGAIAWAMPLFVCLPAVLAARIGQPSREAMKRATMVAAILVLSLAIGGQLAMRMALARGADGISEPRRDIAESITATWRAGVTTPLPLVAGDQRLASAAIIFSPDHPQAWPSFNPTHAPWIDPAAVVGSGFVALCRKGDSVCTANALRHAGGRAVTCQLKQRVTYLGAAGPWFEAVAVLVPPAQAAGPIACPAN